MLDKETRLKQIESRKETGFSIKGFSRRDFAIMAVIAGTALTDPDILYSINPHSRFKTDDEELELLGEKVKNFLEV